MLSLLYFFISFALNWAGDPSVIFGSTHVGRKVFFALAKPGWLSSIRDTWEQQRSEAV